MENDLPPCSGVSFLHAVGQSTLRQGLTVPRIAHIGWIQEIKKGCNIPITIAYPPGRSVVASLRRIDNARGHLQFRYESKKQASFRDYLASTFGSTSAEKNAVLRITEVQTRVFLFEPVSDGTQRSASLSLWRPHFHKCSTEQTLTSNEFRELEQCLFAIPYDRDSTQTDYNKRIATYLQDKGWRNESRILKEIGLRCDFEKNGVWVEVEFGNARVYYQDYIKFLLAQHYREGRLGILLCPTSAFAQLLCDLGRQRAIAERTKRGQADRIPSYSGMMSYEKALRELPFLEFMLPRSMVVAGIEIRGGSQLPQPIQKPLYPDPPHQQSEEKSP